MLGYEHSDDEEEAEDDDDDDDDDGLMVPLEVNGCWDANRRRLCDNFKGTKVGSMVGGAQVSLGDAWSNNKGEK